MRLCEENGAECKSCNGENCNDRSSYKTCLNCSSADDGPECATDPKSIHNKVCRSYNDQCFTHIGREHVSRGCFNEKGKDLEACRSNPDKCAVCNEHSCNDQTIQLDTCIDCYSVMNSECRDNPDAVTDKLCSGIRQSPSEGCYLRVVSYFVVVARFEKNNLITELLSAGK